MVRAHIGSHTESLVLCVTDEQRRSIHPRTLTNGITNMSISFLSAAPSPPVGPIPLPPPPADCALLIGKGGMSLLALSDDVVLNVLEHADVAQVAAAAASCSKLAALCSSDTLWQTLVQSRWPLMQYGAPSSWRDVHRARVSLPRWRATWSYMDEVEHMLPLLDAELAEAQCERLVALLLGIFCTGQPVSPTDDREGRSWAWRLATTSLVSDSVLSILSTWSKTLAASRESLGPTDARASSSTACHLPRSDAPVSPRPPPHL